ncbi:MAG: hypothetical protein M1834_004440 [Cirrosporium novae-zelandiae]|nr:MAG: hypothetical protein M1834_004440 [Cirrosporium novae-zelandiae]
MNAPYTPSKSDAGVNAYVQLLNSRWNLDLPFHDPALWSPSRKNLSKNGVNVLRNNCLGYIKHLHNEDGHALNRVIEDFEEWAKFIRSEWRWKPNQEEEVLPSISRSNSLLLESSFLKRNRIDELAIPKLLAHLEKLLYDECYLVQGRIRSNSDLYDDNASMAQERSTPVLPPEVSAGEDPQAVSNISSSKKVKASPTIDYYFHKLESPSAGSTARKLERITAPDTTNDDVSRAGSKSSKRKSLEDDEVFYDCPSSPVFMDEDSYSDLENSLIECFDQDVSTTDISTSQNSEYRPSSYKRRLNSPRNVTKNKSEARRSYREASATPTPKASGLYERSIDTSSSMSSTEAPSIFSSMTGIRSGITSNATSFGFDNDDDQSTIKSYPQVPTFKKERDFYTQKKRGNTTKEKQQSDTYSEGAVKRSPSYSRDTSNSLAKQNESTIYNPQTTIEWSKQPRNHSYAKKLTGPESLNARPEVTKAKQVEHDTQSTNYDSQGHRAAFEALCEESFGDSIGLDAFIDFDPHTDFNTNERLIVEPKTNVDSDRVTEKLGRNDDMHRAPLDPLLVKIKESSPLKNRSPSYLGKLPLRMRYEVERIGRSWGIMLEEMNRGLDVARNTEYNRFWEWAQRLAQNKDKSLPPKTNSKVWEKAVDTFEDPNTSNSISLSGQLSWSGSKDFIFDFNLNPLRLERSSRFLRRFGSHRFLTIGIPSLAKHDIPKKFQHDSENFQRAVATWLGTEEHHFLGRVWKALYVDQEKGMATKKGNKNKFRVYLFAISGSDISTLHISDLVDWHLHSSSNSSMAYCKAFQRLHLGLSKTYQTAVLYPGEIVYRADTLSTPQSPSDKPMVMNDGCARMSWELAAEISKSLHLENRVPSVFQGRIAGAKGVWMVERKDCSPPDGVKTERNYWIEITDQQLKVKPHPAFDKSIPDPFQWAFEVVAWSSRLSPAALNYQLILILINRGVPRKLLEQLMIDDIKSFAEALDMSMDSPLSTKKWIQMMSSSTEERVRYMDIEKRGSFPKSRDEQINILLDSGFVPSSCQPLKILLKDALRDYLNRRIEKFQIQVPQSAYPYCIADPYGVLKENEVHLGFSENFTGSEDILLHEVDVLVARLPAAFPSDIQRRRAVWHFELSHFKNVIVFPSVGKVPLAHLLSGGDYDGDRVWTCWNESLVKDFVNADLLDTKTLPGLDEFGIIQDKTPLSAVLPDVGTCQPTSKRQREFHTKSDLADRFLSASFEFNLNSSFLGLCTNLLETVCYCTNNLSCLEATKLAHLASLLVDAPKQGYKFTESAWFNFSKRIAGKKSLVPPAYKSSNPQRRKKSNVLDYLKFWVAEEEVNKALSNFHNHWGKVVAPKDTVLTQVWKTELKFANQLAKQGKPHLLKVLRGLENQIKKAHIDWEEQTRVNPDKEDEPNISFKDTVQNSYEAFQSIMPPDEPSDSDLISRWSFGMANENCPKWHLLRASCAYNLYGDGDARYPWYVAGEQLCNIKPMNSGDPFRIVTMPVYLSLKIDSKFVKRMEEVENGQEGEDDEFPDPDIDQWIEEME